MSSWSLNLQIPLSTMKSKLNNTKESKLPWVALRKGCYGCARHSEGTIVPPDTQTTLRLLQLHRQSNHRYPFRRLYWISHLEFCSLALISIIRKRLTSDRLFDPVAWIRWQIAVSMSIKNKFMHKTIIVWYHWKPYM